MNNFRSQIFEISNIIMIFDTTVIVLEHSDNET